MCECIQRYKCDETFIWRGCDFHVCFSTFPLYFMISLHIFSLLFCVCVFNIRFLFLLIFSLFFYFYLVSMYSVFRFSVVFCFVGVKFFVDVCNGNSENGKSNRVLSINVNAKVSLLSLSFFVRISTTFNCVFGHWRVCVCVHGKIYTITV